jgi:hypothetical protein
VSRPQQTTCDHLYTNVGWRMLALHLVHHVSPLRQALPALHKKISSTLATVMCSICAWHGCALTTQTQTNTQNHSKSFKIIQTRLVTYQVLVAFNSFVQDVFGFNRSTAFNWFFSSHEKNLQNTMPLGPLVGGKVNSCKTGAVPVPDQTPNIRT